MKCLECLCKVFRGISCIVKSYLAVCLESIEGISGCLYSEGWNLPVLMTAATATLMIMLVLVSSTAAFMVVLMLMSMTTAAALVSIFMFVVATTSAFVLMFITHIIVSLYKSIFFVISIIY